jgi:hypothetical protein
MFEETNNNSFHTDRFFGRFKLVVLEMVADGTNWAFDQTGTSPGLATTAGAGTIAITGIPKGSKYWFPGSPDVVNSAATVIIAAQDASAGTMTLTASAVTNALRFQWFFLVNRTG